MVTQHRLKEVLDYNFDTGVFTWKKKTSKKIVVGQVAGCLDGQGYIMIKVDGKIYKAHRLAWLYVNGAFPSRQIDHINRVKADNRICNLREALPWENQQNHPMHSSNTSGVVGVNWSRHAKKWRAQIKHNGRNLHLGYYENMEDAIVARAMAKAKYHTFHPEDSNEKAA
jgi:hypothetical protein